MICLDEISREEFEKLKNAAAEKMREMGNRQQARPPFPDFVRVPQRMKEETEAPPQNENREQREKRQLNSQKLQSRADNFLRYMNIPELLKDKDALLILGLILLLLGEDADETLVMALAYIVL